MAAILEQHAELRHRLAACDVLTRRLEQGQVSAGELAAAIAALRRAFAEHTRFEESVLRPLFLAAGPDGPVDADRMLDVHIREHRDVETALDAGGAVRAALHAVERHLSDEEHYFATLHGASDDGEPIDVPD
jgi:hypothetical protein